MIVLCKVSPGGMERIKGFFKSYGTKIFCSVTSEIWDPVNPLRKIVKYFLSLGQCQQTKDAADMR